MRDRDIKIRNVDKKIMDTRLRLNAFVKWDAPTKRLETCKQDCMIKLRNQLDFLRDYSSKQRLKDESKTTNMAG